MRRRGKRLHRGGAAAVLAAVLILMAAALSACSGSDEALPPRESSTAVDGEAALGLSGKEWADDAAEEAPATSPVPAQSAGDSGPGGLGLAERSLGRKVISNATLQIEVERGHFQNAFDQALLLADRYGGYVVSSQASGSGEDAAVRSGLVTIRVPSLSFSRVLTDAGKLGELRSREIDSQDVTEEFVDLEARLTNAEAQERSMRALLDQAKTVEEILQVRQVLGSIQSEIEQLKGRLRFLDEHTSYSTVTISVYESGVQVALVGGWGFGQALKDAARGFVGTLNGMIVGLGEALPVLILFAFVVWVAYRLIRPALRRRLTDTAAPVRQDERPVE
jgi:hypothetical protein